MQSCWKKILLLGVFAGVPAAASINAEMEGMEVDSRDDGTFLVGSPTYFFDRMLGAGGVHSESELWSPEKLRYRLLFNRFSVLPSWDPMEPSVWLKTGNELGDMIYQDFITSKNRPDNRTPILEGGFRSPSFKGFWATARMFQDDHFSSKTRSVRHKKVDDEFSLFGENYPMFSSGYAGLGFTNASVNASALVGEEYLWLFGESSRWILRRSFMKMPSTKTREKRNAGIARNGTVLSVTAAARRAIVASLVSRPDWLSVRSAIRERCIRNWKAIVWPGLLSS